MTSDTRQNQPGARLRLAFLSAIVALVAAFAASASPIPVYNTYRAEQGLTNVPPVAHPGRPGTQPKRRQAAVRRTPDSRTGTSSGAEHG